MAVTHTCSVGSGRYDTYAEWPQFSYYYTPCLVMALQKFNYYYYYYFLIDHLCFITGPGRWYFRALSLRA